MDVHNRIPIIRLWDLLVVPVQGDVDDAHAERLVSDVLADIQRRGCSGLLVDLSGVWTLDSHLCAVMVRLSRAASLMGAPTVLSGMRPEIAMTLQAMGITLSGIETVATLEDALETRGVRRNRSSGPAPEDDLLATLTADEPEEERT